jgi:hypothetical protein
MCDLKAWLQPAASSQQAQVPIGKDAMQRYEFLLDIHTGCVQAPGSQPAAAHSQSLAVLLMQQP